MNKKTVYVSGYGKAHDKSAITKIYGIFALGMIVDTNTDEILEVEGSLVLELTKTFLKYLFVGEKITDEKKIIGKVNDLYFGASKKAFIIAYKDALRRYNEKIKYNI